MREPTSDESTLNQPSTVFQRCFSIGLVLFFAFGAGWLFGSTGKDLAIAKVTDERDALLTRIETLQDPIELDLIRKRPNNC